MAEGGFSLSSFKEQFDDHLTCSVCLDQYTNPKTLPCLHSFCLKCIQPLPTIIQDGNYYISCPTCRDHHLVPVGGATNLPNDFQINSLLDLCNRLTIAPTESNSTCSKHNHPLLVYCETCNQAICLKCTIRTVEHRTHEYDLISDCYIKHHQQILAKLSQVRQNMTDLNTMVTQLDTTEREVIEQGEELQEQINTHAQQIIDQVELSRQEQINTHAQQIIDQVERSREHLSKQLHNIVKQKKKLLATQKYQVRLLLTQLNTHYEMIVNSLTGWTKIQILTAKRTMINQINIAARHIDPTVFQPVEKADIKFTKIDWTENRTVIGSITSGTNEEAVSFKAFQLLAIEPSTAAVTLHSSSNPEPSSVIEKFVSEKDVGLTSLEKKPSVKKQSPQFNYMIPVNDGLDDVHIGGETVHLIQGSHTQCFNWTRWGIRMYFSDNTVASDETCEVAVKALIGGKFLFPSASDLISAVYAISFARKLAKPVRLEIQHCALLKAEDSQFKYLSFVKAPMNERRPPFEFSPLEGGSFDLNSQYGSITLDHFCLIGIISRIYRYIFPLPAPDGHEDPPAAVGTTQTVAVQSHKVTDINTLPELLYAVRLYYRHGCNVNHWIAMFMAVKNLNALKTFINETYPDSKQDQTVYFQFDKDKTEPQTLELVMNNEQHITAGWEVSPHTTPLTISKHVIDLFGSSDGIPEPPSCMISVSATLSPETRSLYYCIPIKGVISDTKQINIFRPLEPTVQSAHGRQQPFIKTEAGILPPFIKTEDIPIRDIVNCIKGEFTKLHPDLEKLFDTDLKSITGHLLAVGLLTDQHAKKPSYHVIIGAFLTGFLFVETINDITIRCQTFFGAMYKVGGDFCLAAGSVKKQINESLLANLNITLNL